MRAALIVPIQDPTPFSPFSPTTGLTENLKRANKAGYDGVELAITDPQRLTPTEREQLLKAFNETGLTVAAITTGQAYGIEGISFTEEDPDLRRRAIERVKVHIRFVRELGLGAVVIIGLIRGERGGEEARELLIEALEECAAVDSTIKLALEPLNRYETGLVNNVNEALEVLDRVRARNVGILFDTFHANIEEASIEESIRRAGGRILHVHLADSNRWPPGYGHLCFKSILSALEEIGYRGFLSAEVLAKPNPDASIEEGIEYLKRL